MMFLMLAQINILNILIRILILQAMAVQGRRPEFVRRNIRILMVHGIFFCDEHYFNYWRRAPRELMPNCGEVLYQSIT